MSTRKKAGPFKDPQAEREARKYAHPVPSREAVLAGLKQSDEPLSFKRLTGILCVEGERDLEAFSRRLRAMERDGQLLKNRRGLYGLIDRMDMVCGSVIGHPDGFGFLAPEDNSKDLFLSPREMRKVMHGDRVMGRVTGVDARGRREGVIIEVLEHRHSNIVGRYTNEGNLGLVVPEDKRITQDIFIPEGDEGDARHGQIVAAEIVQQPTARVRATGRITEVIGDHMAPGMETDVIIRKYELPFAWPEAVMAEAANLGKEVTETSKRGRKDVRHLPLVTIDGADAKDFDDAVYCKRDGKGWRLFVAIADVSYYVKPDSTLNEEAYRRGTSVYFPNRVIPMLPEALSNGLCSLKPKVDRLCVVCEMEIGARGKIRNYRFYEAVMRSHARLTYTEVAATLVDGDAGLRRKYSDVVPNLEELYRLYKMLHKVRLDRGSVDFELPETRIIFDEFDKIERIEVVERNDAHRLIEECMLAANVCAAEFLEEHKIPAPYRVHAGPTEEKLTALREFLFEFGLSLRGGSQPRAEDYAEVLKAVADRPNSRLIQTVMLRSLSQAIYSPENIGHFALSYASYAHFTSPIRRYPDLMVHRSIKALLEKKSGAGRITHSVKGILGRKPAAEFMSEVKTQSEHCSMTGRRADEAGWDVIKWLKTEYMMDQVGEEFEGIISGVTNFGIFVELKDLFIEGLVHVTALGNDYYRFDPIGHRLTGERTREVLRLGDEVRVQIARVDLDEARIDLELVGKKERPRHGLRSKKKPHLVSKKRKTGLRRKNTATRKTMITKTTKSKSKKRRKKRK